MRVGAGAMVTGLTAMAVAIAADSLDHLRAVARDIIADAEGWFDLEEVGAAGTGLVAHLSPAVARRLRVALRDALREVGEDEGV